MIMRSFSNSNISEVFVAYLTYSPYLKRVSKVLTSQTSRKQATATACSMSIMGVKNPNDVESLGVWKRVGCIQ